MQFIIGSDPELFGKTADGTLVPSEQFVPAGDNGLVVRDGVQVEIHPVPARDIDSFTKHTLEALNEAKLLGSRSSVDMSTDELVEVDTKTLSKYANTFGCKPSYNAYGNEVRPPSNASSVSFRSAGGHIHIGGYDDEAFDMLRDDPNHVMLVLDAVVGLYSVMNEDTSAGIRRRKYYGRAGDYRLPPHGLEYRVPSNFWIWNEGSIRSMYNVVIAGLTLAGDAEKSTEMLSAVSKAGYDIESIINTSDQEAAKKAIAIIKPYIN